MESVQEEQGPCIGCLFPDMAKGEFICSDATLASCGLADGDRVHVVLAQGGNG